MKTKTKKKPKLKKLCTIRRRLHKMWSELVRSRNDFICELCGVQRGNINERGKPVKIDAHHFLVKEIKDSPLKYEILNGVAVCPFCHKFGIPSFHRDPLRTMAWLLKNHPERYNYVLENADERVDLDNRHVLEAIEEMLKEGGSLDLNKLKSVAQQFPRKTRAKPKLEGDLMEDFEDVDVDNIVTDLPEPEPVEQPEF